MNFRHLFIPYLLCSLALALLMSLEQLLTPAKSKPDFYLIGLTAIPFITGFYAVLNLAVDCLRIRLKKSPKVICPALAVFWALIAFWAAATPGAMEGFSSKPVAFLYAWALFGLPSMLYGVPYTILYFTKTKKA